MQEGRVGTAHPAGYFWISLMVNPMEII
jgi:hypothetical protein